MTNTTAITLGVPELHIDIDDIYINNSETKIENYVNTTILPDLNTYGAVQKEKLSTISIATTENLGLVRLATTDEVAAGTETTAVLTPYNAKSGFVDNTTFNSFTAQANTALAEKADFDDYESLMNTLMETSDMLFQNEQTLNTING